MEKFGVSQDGLLNSLRDEEAQLMQKMSAHMMTREKTAAEEGECQALETRLQGVRAKISEIDLKHGQ